MSASKFGTGSKHHRLYRVRRAFGTAPPLSQAEVLEALGLDLTGAAGFTVKVKADESGLELVP